MLSDEGDGAVLVYGHAGAHCAHQRLPWGEWCEPRASGCHRGCPITTSPAPPARTWSTAALISPVALAQLVFWIGLIPAQRRDAFRAVIMKTISACAHADGRQRRRAARVSSLQTKHRADLRVDPWVVRVLYSAAIFRVPSPRRYILRPPNVHPLLAPLDQPRSAPTGTSGHRGFREMFSLICKEFLVCFFNPNPIHVPRRRRQWMTAAAMH